MALVRQHLHHPLSMLVVDCLLGLRNPWPTLPAASHHEDRLDADHLDLLNQFLQVRGQRPRKLRPDLTVGTKQVVAHQRNHRQGALAKVGFVPLLHLPSNDFCQGARNATGLVQKDHIVVAGLLLHFRAELSDVAGG